MTTTLEERVQALEIDTAVIRHDVNNIRMMVTGLESKIDRLATVVESKVDKLEGNIFRIGMSIVAAILLLLISAVGFFVTQNFNSLNELERGRAVSQTQR